MDLIEKLYIVLFDDGYESLDKNVLLCMNIISYISKTGKIKNPRITGGLPQYL